MTNKSVANRIFSRAKIIVLVAATWVVAGCTQDIEVRQKAVGLWTAADVPVKERRFLAAEWDTLWRLQSKDTAKPYSPRFVSASADRVYVYDDKLQSILAFDSQGKMLWNVADVATKKLQLHAGIDIETAPNGMLAVLDGEHSKIDIVSRAGELVNEIALPKSPRIAQIAPLDENRILVAPVMAARLAVIDRTGKKLQDIAFPWAGAANLNPLARQGIMTSNRKGMWVFAFSFGDGWFGFRDTQPMSFIGKYVDYRPFPDVTVSKSGDVKDMSLAEYSPCTGCSVSMSDSSVYFLAGGSNTTMEQVIDEFDLTSGNYKRSYRLPSPALDFEVVGEVMYVILSNDPHELIALRPRLTTAAASIAHRKVGK